MSSFARLSALSLFTVVALARPLPALAADVVFAPGMRVGFVPADGLKPAAGFAGFESEDHSVKVLTAELPAGAYTEVEAAVKNAAPSASGVKPESIDTAAGKGFYTAEDGTIGTDKVRRYSMIVPGPNVSGYIAVQVADPQSKTYSEDAIRAMFKTVTLRKDVPTAEQLALLPFNVTDLAGFKTVRTLAPGVAALLADGTDEAGIETAPYMIVGAINASPEKPDDRGRFAQQAAAEIPGLREGHITSSEPMRIDGTPGYETRIDAVNVKDNTPVTVVQWLRFGGSNASLRIIASAPRDQWAAAFPRFRAVRDGIQPK